MDPDGLVFIYDGATHRVRMSPATRGRLREISAADPRRPVILRVPGPGPDSRALAYLLKVVGMSRASGRYFKIEVESRQAFETLNMLGVPRLVPVAVVRPEPGLTA